MVSSVVFELLTNLASLEEVFDKILVQVMQVLPWIFKKEVERLPEYVPFKCLDTCEEEKSLSSHVASSSMDN